MAFKGVYSKAAPKSPDYSVKLESYGSDQSVTITLVDVDGRPISQGNVLTLSADAETGRLKLTVHTAVNEKYVQMGNSSSAIKVLREGKELQ